MTWSLETLAGLGDVEVAALAKCDCDVRCCGSKFVGYGRKVPVLVLMKASGVVSGIDLAGTAVSETEIEQRFPGAIAAFEGSQ